MVLSNRSLETHTHSHTIGLDRLVLARDWFIQDCNQLLDESFSVCDTAPHGYMYTNLSWQSCPVSCVCLISAEPEGDDDQWDRLTNEAPQVANQMTVLEGVREGAAPVGVRPERRCRRIEPYGR